MRTPPSRMKSSAPPLAGWARALVVLLLAVAIALPACRDETDGTAPISKEPLPEVSFGKRAQGYLLTWLDEDGAAHVETRATEVPVEGRDMVRVVFDDREEGQRDPIYVANLNRPGDDGEYIARSFARRDWESEIARRREKYLAKVRPTPIAPPDASEGPPNRADPPAKRGALTVIIYGADWCKPCHEAADYLRSKGVAVIVKDIVRDPRAQAEMRKKLERIGRRGGSIPIIDVGGQILVGYSRGALDRALSKTKSRRGGTTL